MTASPMSPIAAPALAPVSHSFVKALLGFMVTTATCVGLLMLVSL